MKVRAVFISKPVRSPALNHTFPAPPSPGLRRLAKNSWANLFAMNESGKYFRRYGANKFVENSD
jgi:hypothetical protein